ncbi:transposase [Staphylococcus gallinarum]|uniref:transposase n=1 Tax=Staphylococcus TaxID=1279 RepID=UPI001E308070|nr:transposase [Staphylococcus gallinarum]MCD8825185.1 transposase [Staphylococcus gallinarum]
MAQSLMSTLTLLTQVSRKQYEVLICNYYKNNDYDFKRGFKLDECDDCSGCPHSNRYSKHNSETNKKVLRNYNWESFKTKINQQLSEPEIQRFYNQNKIEIEAVFVLLKAICGFTRMSLRGITRIKHELGLALLAINISKIITLSDNQFDNNRKIDNFYIFTVKIIDFILV